MVNFKDIESFIDKSGEFQKKLIEMAPKIEKVKAIMLSMGKSIAKIASKMMAGAQKILPFVNVGLRILSIYLSVNKIMSKASKTTTTLSNNLSSMAGKVKTAMVSMVAGVTKSASSVMSLAKKTSEVANGINKMSETTGQSTTRLQELKYVASQTGVDFNAIQESAKTLSQTMEQAASGGTQQAEAFNALGISLLDNNEKMLSTDEIYNQTLMKLAAMGDETERNALGTQIFGEGFTNMIPMLNAGTEGIQKYSEQANQFGLVMDEEAIAANLEFSNSMSTLSSVVEALKGRFATALMPIIQLFLDWIINNMPTIQGVFDEVFKFIGNVVSKVAGLFSDHLLPILTKLLQWVGEKFPSIQEFFTSVFNVLWEYLSKIFVFFKESIMPGLLIFFEWLSENFPKIQEFFMSVFTTIWEVVNKVFKLFIENLLPVLAMLFTWIMENFPSIQGFFIETFNTIWGIVEKVYKIFLEDLLPILMTLYSWIEPTFPLIAEIIGAAFDTVIGIVEGVIDIFEAVIETIKDIIDFIDSMIQKIKKAIEWFSKLFTKGGNSSYIPDTGIPGAADGGRIITSGRVLVGERGPEILELPKNARVLPLKRISGNGGNRTINQSVTINSPTPLSPSEIKKKTLEVSRQLAMEWGV